MLAWREFALFLDCDGQRRATGRSVIEVEIEVDDLAPQVRATNAHLPGVRP